MPNEDDELMKLCERLTDGSTSREVASEAICDYCEEQFNRCAGALEDEPTPGPGPYSGPAVEWHAGYDEAMTAAANFIRRYGATL